MLKTDTINLIKILKNTYPDAKCSLNYTTPFELLVAVMLSAQCTDARVNLVTPQLFKKYPTPHSYINSNIKDIENLIKPCGFYKVKAAHIKETATILAEKYNGEVPSCIDELITLPGVGRKTANVVLLEAFDISEGIAVDTHVKRVATRIGFSNELTPEKIEQDLLKQIPKKYIKEINHLLIFHGRAICKAQNPKCNQCPILHLCKRLG